MEIKVLGSGCSKCRSIIGVIERAAQASGVDVEIIKVENPDEIKRTGVTLMRRRQRTVSKVQLT